jgi:hypothetical protein
MATKLIVNCLDNTVEEVELTAEEIAEREVDALAFQEAEEIQNQAKLDKQAARQAVLTKLGLTAEEAAALLA